MQRVIYLRRPLHRRDQRGLQQQLERAFQNQWPQSNALIVITQREVWRPPTDVYETESAVVVRIEMAGMRDAEIAITLDERGLRIEGQRPERRDDRPLSYHQMGINYGAFAVEVFLARPFDHEHVTARYDDGFLFVELPKANFGL
ncbi:MAG TPA: Hsp20/alpha crystallin family protein [Roseiflexaceae bacterium]|nr:Hsp20/alpha crystallin family protein [Roseiflexaceae bacterium]